MHACILCNAVSFVFKQAFETLIIEIDKVMECKSLKCARTSHISMLSPNAGQNTVLYKKH